jgi:hypothetical protein
LPYRFSHLRNGRAADGADVCSFATSARNRFPLSDLSSEKP